MLASCSGPPGAGRQLGEDLGTFHVDAVETTNDCGPGALGSSDRFAFDVELSRASSELFWDGRVGGRVQASLDFDVLVRVTVTLRASSARSPGCAIARQDSVSGMLGADASGEIVALTGAMTYDFSPEPASACTLDDQQAAGLPRLPCGMSYTLGGRRTRAPGLALEPGADPE
jgi:hypothetical protein